jgi:3-oxoacyl-[acyl-carrier protein] reductase
MISDGWRGDGVLSPALPKIEKIDDPCDRIEAENRERDPSPVLTLGEEPCEHCVNDGEYDHALKNPNTLARPTAVQKIGAQILDDFGKIDILVNNAGVRRDGLSLGMSMKDWDMVINTNLKGAFNFVQATERVMIKQRSGRIINITSVIGMIGNAGQTNYAASKAGLIGFTKSLARELASRNITVNAVAPGFVTTGMTSGLSEEIKKTIHSKIPLGRTGTPEEIASAVAFLASAEANYITDQVLCVDGGIVM